ncbi:PmoA family protein [Halalkalibaculum sp. DA3122]
MRNFIIGIIIVFMLGLAGFMLLGKANKIIWDENKKGKQILSWKQSANSLSLLNNGEIVWQLNYDKDKDKPYFYPLRTPSGINLALERPDDHPWHRGLWFAWKYINGVNYWEEEPGTGLSEGRSLIKNVVIEERDDFSAKIKIDIDYSPNLESPIMSENRTLLISPPDKNGNYTIDWHHRFTANDDTVTLDRTPPARYGGEQWGGYAGLGYRADDNELSSIRFINSEGWTNRESLIGFGKRANWMDLTGISTESQSKKAGLTIFDHPSNPRHPSPWYIWYNNDGDGTSQNYNHAFFQPALLFNEPFQLAPAKSFELKYRVLVHSGALTMDELSKRYQMYIKN